ncbi:glycosyltransferase family 4 protein [Candidatus Parcubacteria bacterium]|nr:glycosyltransferase family 4 protein [Candidatus Parcubacteria bacterium]
MKIYYIINSRFPNEKAEGLESMKISSALSDFADVCIIKSFRFNKIKKNPFSFYGTEKEFPIITLPCLDIMPLRLGKFSFLVQTYTYLFFLLIYLLLFTKKDDIILSHEANLMFFVSQIRKNSFFDMHDFPRSKLSLFSQLFEKLRGIITTNKWKKTELEKKFNIKSDKILSHPNGVDIAKFDLDITKEEARKELKLPQNKILIGYVGMLKTMGMEKGIDVAIQAMKQLDEKYKLVLVGGNKEDIDYYKKYADSERVSDKIIFVGWMKNSVIPKYLKAFDMVIAPFPAGDHYNYFMSPMKVFEYMASKRPMIASDLVSIRELAGDDECIFVKPDDSQSLLKGVERVIDDRDLSNSMAYNAHEAIKKFTWESRAKSIINFIENKTNL